MWPSAKLTYKLCALACSPLQIFTVRILGTVVNKQFGKQEQPELIEVQPYITLTI